MKKILTVRIFSLFAGAFLLLTFCKQKKAVQEIEASKWYYTASEEQLLDSVQRQTFRYFWNFAEPNSGMARERYHPEGIYPQNDKHIVTTGGTGFGIMAILVGIERRFITRRQGIERIIKIVNFLEKADRFHGIWPHWINGETGKVKPFSKKDDGGDIVESAYLIQGLLCVRQYCDPANDTEKKLAEKIDALWKEMEWDWHTNGKEILYWHWSPKYAWEMNFGIQGYNECLIAYVLAASSPTYPVKEEVYHKGWARNGKIKATDSYLGYERILDHYDRSESPVGPLFWAHYSYLALNPYGLKDQYADYWKLNQNHSLIHYKHGVDNPNNYKGYGKDCWGLTSSYSTPKNGKISYASHRPDKDKGVISPTAALSSIPYTPKESLQAIRKFYSFEGKLLGPAGFYDAFSPHHGWVVKKYLAIDQGPIIVMIENYRSGLFWELFMSCPEVQQGLKKLEFSFEKKYFTSQ